MSEGTVLTIFTLVNVLWELSAKLSLVFFNVIKTLDSVMSQVTIILTLAFVSLRVITQFRRILSYLSSFVFN